MRRVLWATFLGLIGAGIVHIVVILMVPHVSEGAVWNRLAEVARFDGPTPIDGHDSGSVIRPYDPAFAVSVCLFDLSEGYRRVASDGRVPFWSASVYDRNGSNLMAVNGASAPNGVLDLFVLSPDQLVELRRDEPDQMERSVFAETTALQGAVVVRALVPDPSWAGVVQTFMEELRCDLS
jgi:uncharacterized membrane protein